MVVTAKYNDGTSKEVTGYSYPVTALAVGTTSITITYSEGGVTETTTVAITVKSSFDPAGILSDFTYVDNGDGTYTITGWKGTLNGASSTTCSIPDSDKIIVNPLA